MEESFVTFAKLIDVPSPVDDCIRVFLSSRSSLGKFIRSRVSNIEDAEDLLQETYVEALRNYTKYKGDSTPETWMFGIALNLIRNYFRRNYSKPTLCELEVVDYEYSEDNFDLESRIHAIRLLERTLQATMRLTTDMRDILLLILDSQGNYNELAAHLDIPVGTVRSRLSRAREALRRQVLD
ncbi:sigma factor [Pseudomonas synxantha]|uniref:Sigma factor n=1 Tax=Pseudomonas synxantha TaxID=47883 RepID=A0A3G7UEC8_9PSED|nr:RNA polymerase sigma factor [Pseudomonas synxantha]AZE56892.1 sigma factor [Pseudomonas synxantha]